MQRVILVVQTQAHHLMHLSMTFATPDLRMWMLTNFFTVKVVLWAGAVENVDPCLSWSSIYERPRATATSRMVSLSRA